MCVSLLCFVFSVQGAPGVRGAQGLPVSTVIAPLHEMIPGGDLNCFNREHQVQKESQERD